MFDRLLLRLTTNRSKDKQYYNMVYDLFGFRANNIELYKLALIHRSASMCLQDGTMLNNERLEFLGDAVLETIVSDYLFVEFPDHKEGFLSKLRARIVSRTSLNEIATKIGLDKHIVVQFTGGMYIQKHLFGNTLEAMIGAMYLDKGYNFTNRLIINELFKKYLDLQSLLDNEDDHKSRLIEFCQKEKLTINFVTIPSDKATNHIPHFHTNIEIAGEVQGEGEGGSKKEAEQRAASVAMAKLGTKSA
ncbi:MAG: ribonuclease III [Rikenellaceae bacterium]